MWLCATFGFLPSSKYHTKGGDLRLRRHQDQCENQLTEIPKKPLKSVFSSECTPRKSLLLQKWSILNKTRIST